MLKKIKMCNFDDVVMHNKGWNVHFSSFFAQKICKCEIKFVTLHPILKIVG